MIELGATTLVEWSGLKDNATDSFINDATVSGVLKNAKGQTLGTFSLPYKAASDGVYQGYITTAMVSSVKACEELTVELTATKGAFTGFRKFVDVANYRGKK